MCHSKMTPFITIKGIVSNLKMCSDTIYVRFRCIKKTILVVNVLFVLLMYCISFMLFVHECAIKCIDVLFRNLICITLFDKYLYFECLQYVQGAEIDM